MGLSLVARKGLRIIEREYERDKRVEDKKEIEGGNGGKERPSCMIGVSGRFLCDIHVEAWSQRSTDAT